MNSDFIEDLEEMKKSIDDAEVVSLFFLSLRKAVVIDRRFNDTEGPMVRIMPLAASPQERLRSIRRLRPNFPRLRNLTAVPWPRYVDSLVTLGVWESVVQRFVDSGHEEAVAACEWVLDELRRLEKTELSAVVSGENYHTIWSAAE